MACSLTLSIVYISIFSDANCSAYRCVMMMIIMMIYLDNQNYMAEKINEPDKASATVSVGKRVLPDFTLRPFVGKNGRYLIDIDCY